MTSPAQHLSSAIAKRAENRALTIPEAAALLGCHPRTVRRAVRRSVNPLPHFKVGEAVRIWPAALTNQPTN